MVKSSDVGDATEETLSAFYSDADLELSVPSSSTPTMSDSGTPPPVEAGIRTPEISMFDAFSPHMESRLNLAPKRPARYSKSFLDVLDGSPISRVLDFRDAFEEEEYDVVVPERNCLEERDGVDPLASFSSSSQPTVSASVELPEEEAGCRTPLMRMYDSFAPRTDSRVNLLPRRTKRLSKPDPDILDGSPSSRVTRVLNFGEDSAEELQVVSDSERGDSEERYYLEFLYNEFLEVITSNQIENHSAEENDYSSPRTPQIENHSVEENDSSSPRTPTSPREDVHDTCPGAPMRRNSEFKAPIEFGSTCRKLEF